MIWLQRLNMDSSWLIKLGEVSLLVDPWLVGSEVDGFRWLNEQWHVKDPVRVEDLPDYQAILVTQSYEDHCHLNTLKLLDPDKPIIATGKAHKRLSKEFPQRDLRLISEAAALDFLGTQFKSFRPNKKMDPVYFAVHLTSSSGAIFYAPHGFSLTQPQLSSFEGSSVDILMTTFTTFKLPGIMGGLVNPGLKNVQQLVEQLNPGKVINTHDEPKKGRGLVAKLAKITWPDYHWAEQNFPFERIEDYQIHSV